MNRQSLEDAISQLDSLMMNDDAPEDDFQEWFESNPVVLEVLNYQQSLPHPKLTEEGVAKYIPDFLVQRVDGLWEILEIKRPDTGVLKDKQRRTSFYSSMETYISQCREYSEHFDDRSNRDEFTANYNETIQKRPSSILIAGRSDGLNRQKVHGLLSGRVPPVLHQTYDDVRNHLEFQRVRLYGNYENLNGLSIHLIIVIEPPTTPTETFIFDIGQELGRNRLSLYLHRSGTLVWRVLDSLAVSHQIEIPQGTETFEYNKAFYLNLEAGFGQSYSVMVAEINGRYCSEHTLRGFPLELDSPMPLIIGSDMTGEAESFMRITEKIIYIRTLLFHEKSDLRSHFFERYQDFLFGSVKKPKGLEFRNQQCLYSEGHPLFDLGKPRSTNVIQEDPARRPAWRDADL